MKPFNERRSIIQNNIEFIKYLDITYNFHVREKQIILKKSLKLLLDYQNCWVTLGLTKFQPNRFGLP